ncbi:MAG TPA: sulfur carrier protein ThiS [Candidatus Baltobacteraceae bacterium]|jgi:thiamine biosynthesis protein ThiS
MSAGVITAIVNGEARELADGTTVAQVLEALQLPASGVAVAKNDRVVRRVALASERVENGDRIEIIKAVAGG